MKMRLVTAMKSPEPSRRAPDAGFAYRREDFEAYVGAALTHALKLGATDAAAEASEGCGLNVSVRLGKLENVERNRDKSLGVTVYVGQRRGNASTSDFSRAAIEQTVRAAYDIARFTAEDPAAGLPDADDIVREYPEFEKEDVEQASVPVAVPSAVVEAADAAMRGLPEPPMPASRRRSRERSTEPDQRRVDRCEARAGAGG